MHLDPLFWPIAIPVAIWLLTMTAIPFIPFIPTVDRWIFATQNPPLNGPRYDMAEKISAAACILGLGLPLLAMLVACLVKQWICGPPQFSVDPSVEKKEEPWHDDGLPYRNPDDDDGWDGGGPASHYPKR